jgi:transcription elongation factor GreB
MAAILRVYARAFKLKLPAMSKAFVREDADSPQEPQSAQAPAPGGKNYITPAGFARLKGELKQLVELERPEVVKTVAWAASLGDRSENADYIYGKRRLREIDRRVRFLIKRLEAAEIVHSSGRDSDQIFFGARVRVKGASGERTVSIVGVDEVDPAKGHVSWISPIARALIKARAGDVVTLRTPGGTETLEIVEVDYP